MDRTGFIGGSDLYKIIKGDWHELWEIKTGRRQPDDLSNIFKVMLGTQTEAFNINWFLENHPNLQIDDVAYQQTFEKTIAHVPYKGTLDGYLLHLGGKHSVLECKHTSSRNTMDDMLASYLPQIHLYMRISNCDSAYLSVIFGNDWESVRIEWNEDYWRDVHTQAINFWNLVTNDIEPQADHGSKIDWKQVNIDGLSSRCANTDNFFVRTAHEYVETHDVAKQNAEYKKELVALMNDNEREVYCDLLTIKRDKRGAKRITINK